MAFTRATPRVSPSTSSQSVRTRSSTASATKHDATPSVADEQLLIDIDLPILGTEPSTFDVYEREVRQEDAFVPDPSFRAGRAHVLEGFLGRPFVFATPYFHARYGARARENLERSLAGLRALGATPATA